MRSNGGRNYGSKETRVECLDEISWLLLKEDEIQPITFDKSCYSFLSYIADPNHRPYRYIIAFFLSIVEGTLSYCSDFPAGIQSTMIRVMKLDNTHYDMIFSAYTWPDIVMSILGTVLIDKFIGMRKGIVMFTGIMFAGQVVVSIGAFANSFQVILLGRLLLGCGIGTATSLISSFLIIWFSGKEVTFVFSLSRCFHRLSASFALFTPQFTYDALETFIVLPCRRHGSTQMLCSLMCLLAVMCAVIVALLDKRGAKIIGRKPFPKKNISIVGVLRFPMSYWLLASICSLYYGVIIGGFTANAPLFFVNRFGFSKKEADVANSLSYQAVVILTPFISMLIDITGYNLLWGLAGICLAIVSNALYIVGTDRDRFIPYLAAIVCSFSFNCFGSAMWVAIGYLIPKHQLTTAFGVLMSIYALFLTAINICTGLIIDNIGYLQLCIFFLMVLYVALLFNAFLFLSEFYTGKKVLNVTGRARMKS